MISIDVEGIGDLQAALEEKATEYQAALEAVVEESARNVRDEARNAVPVDTGALRDSIEYHTDGLTAEVGSFDVDYGAHVEFGTSSKPERPFMGPAAEIERGRISERVAEALDG